MDDYFVSSLNKSILPPNAPAFLYLDCNVSSDSRGPECQEIIYSYPNNLAPASLVISLRGAFITLVKLSKDTQQYYNKQAATSEEPKNGEGNEFYFLKYRSPNDEMLRVGATVDSHGNLIVLILPSLLFDSSNHQLKEIVTALIEYIQFFFTDMISAVSLNSKELTKFLSVYFYNYQTWINFINSPENVSITCSNHMQIEKIVLSLESASGNIDYSAKNIRIKCRSAQIRGCALFCNNKVVVNHLPYPCLRKLHQYLLLYNVGGWQNTQSNLSVQWLPVHLVCNTNDKLSTGFHALLLLRKNELSLAILTYSCEELKEPPLDCINIGRLCLDDLFQLNKTFSYYPNFQLAKPELFLESGKSSAKEKEESGKYFQWFKSQMSPKTLRKTPQFGSSSSLNNNDDMNLSNQESCFSQSVLTDSRNSLFSYLYIDKSRSSQQILSESTRNESRYENLIKMLDNMFSKFSKMNLWPGCFPVIESRISFTCKIQFKTNNDSSKSKPQELKFTISSHREKNGSLLLICYHSGIPQNLKTLLGKIYRKVHFYDADV